MDPSNYHTHKVSRGFTYNYYYTPANDGKLTLLFLHGFPSTSYDWHKQVPHFAALGYGVLVPDLLGSGATSKPMNSKDFKLCDIAKDVVDILDHLGLAKVVGVGQDW